MSCFRICAVLWLHFMRVCTSWTLVTLHPNVNLEVFHSVINSAMIILVFSEWIALWMVKFLVTHLAAACITQFEEHWTEESEVDLSNSYFTTFPSVCCHRTESWHITSIKFFFVMRFTVQEDSWGSKKMFRYIYITVE